MTAQPAINMDISKHGKTECKWHVIVIMQIVDMTKLKLTLNSA